MYFCLSDAASYKPNNTRSSKRICILLLAVCLIQVHLHALNMLASEHTVQRMKFDSQDCAGPGSALEPTPAEHLPPEWSGHELHGILRDIQISWPYLGGVWDAAGHIFTFTATSTSSLTPRVLLAQSNLHFLSAVHHFLGQHGINSKIYVKTDLYKIDVQAGCSAAETLYGSQRQRYSLQVNISL